MFYSYSMVRPVAILIILLLSVLDKRLFEYLPNLFSVLVFWASMEFFNFLIIPTIYFLQESEEYFRDERTFWKKVLFFYKTSTSFCL